MAMDLYELRRLNLIKLLDGGEVLAAEIARKTGIAASTISAYRMDPSKKGHKNMTEQTARRIESAVRKPARWLDEQHSSKGPEAGGYKVAQVLSQPFVSDVLPYIAWEKIVPGPTPELFRTVLPDDALAPDLPGGTEVVWSKHRKAIPGRAILVRDRHGQPQARICQQSSVPGAWAAVPVNPAYLSYTDSDAELIAVYKGRLEPDDE